MAGDFTGDGPLDLAVANVGDNTISVLLGNGDGTFQPPVTYAVGTFPDGIVAGDFTGNGILDLAVANQNSNNVSVLLGNGDGTFQPQVTYAVGSGPDAIVAGDFTGDGHLDLAVANENLDGTGGGTVSVLLGNGDGTFQPQVTYAVGASPSAIVAGDFRGDGRLDLAVTGGTSGVHILLGNGDGTFQPQVNYAVVSDEDACAIAAGDFSGDGHLDLAVLEEGLGGTPSDVTVLSGNGDGTFQPEPGTGNAVGTGPGAIAAGDFTGNGRTDLAVVNEVSDTVSVLLSNGDGTFQPQVTYAVGSDPDAIVAGDFNGDGHLDLAVVNNGAFDSNFNLIPGSSTVSVLLGNGDGTFQPQVTYAVGTSPFSIVAGDFTGNGILDLAVANAGTSPDFAGTVSVLLGNGDGTFQPQVTYAVGSHLNAIATGDFTGDGKLDLVVADALGIQMLLGNGDGTFQPAQTVANGNFGFVNEGQPQNMAVGDFTGDGRLDLAVLNFSDNTVSVLLGNGDGTFQPQVTYAVGTFPDSIVAGDFSGDGHLDLAVLNEGDNGLANITVSVLLGNGDGTFQPQVTYAVGDLTTDLVAGDFTGDGPLDLAVSSSLSNSVSVLLGTGDGTFVGPGQLATTPYATPLVADVTGDGTDDVLVVDGAGEILSRQGIPGQPGSFLPPVTVNPNHPSRDIAWLPDTNVGPVLASVDAQDDAISFYAYRDGRFVRLDGSLATGQLPAQIVAAQLNGNGLDDLVVRNAGDGTLSVYLGSWFDSGFVGPRGTLAAPIFTAAFILPVGLGVSDVQAVEHHGERRARPGRHQHADRTGEHPPQPGRWVLRGPRALPRRDGPLRGGYLRRLTRRHEPRSDFGRGGRNVPHRRLDRPGDDQLGDADHRRARGTGERTVRQSRHLLYGQSRAGGPGGRLQRRRHR